MAHGLGRFGIFPFDLGGGDPSVPGGSILEAEHEAILTELQKGLDTSEDLEFYQEAYADAVAVTIIWAISDRLRSWLIPSRMLESLPVWEQSTGLRPSGADSDVARRESVAGKLRGLVNNALGDIEQAAIEIMGDQFVELVLVDPDDLVRYWPGLNPGPPGFEWSTNGVIVGVKITKSGLTDAGFSQKRQALNNQLDSMVPSWMSFRVGVGSGFIVNQGIVGQTFL